MSQEEKEPLANEEEPSPLAVEPAPSPLNLTIETQLSLNYILANGLEMRNLDIHNFSTFVFKML